jgi:hypothetical protein
VRACIWVTIGAAFGDDVLLRSIAGPTPECYRPEVQLVNSPLRKGVICGPALAPFLADRVFHAQRIFYPIKRDKLAV